MVQRVKLRVLVIDYPNPKKVRESYKFTSNFVSIIQSIADKVYVISDSVNGRILNKERVHLLKIGISPHFLHEINPRWLSLLIWILKSIMIQMKICVNILKVVGDVNIVIFFMMHPSAEVFPMFFVKLFRKKIVKVPLGIASRGILYAPSVYGFFEKISLHLADYYIPEYESVAVQLKKRLKYPEKLLPAAHFFILEDKFKIKKDIYERQKIVGYIGGFRKIKGVINFVKAIPYVLAKDDEVRFLIAGEGILRSEIEKLIEKYPKDRVTLIDWIPHKKIPEYLNELKLLVIPSYSETGPFIGIEAMAWGTPVLTTKVGVMSLLIKEEETGFVLENNSPKYIAERIIEVLNRDNQYLQKVANNARYTFDKNYSFSTTMDRWKIVLSKIEEET